MPRYAAASADVLVLVCLHLSIVGVRFHISTLPSFCSFICCKHAARRCAGGWLLLAVRFISSSVDCGKRTRLDVSQGRPFRNIVDKIERNKI